jgi:hypothetical protein
MEGLNDDIIYTIHRYCDLETRITLQTIFKNIKFNYPRVTSYNIDIKLQKVHHQHDTEKEIKSWYISIPCGWRRFQEMGFFHAKAVDYYWVVCEYSDHFKFYFFMELGSPNEREFHGHLKYNKSNDTESFIGTDQ